MEDFPYFVMINLGNDTLTDIMNDEHWSNWIAHNVPQDQFRLNVSKFGAVRGITFADLTTALMFKLMFGGKR